MQLGGVDKFRIYVRARIGNRDAFCSATIPESGWFTWKTLRQNEILYWWQHVSYLPNNDVENNERPAASKVIYAQCQESIYRDDYKNNLKHGTINWKKSVQNIMHLFGRKLIKAMLFVGNATKHYYVTNVYLILCITLGYVFYYVKASIVFSIFWCFLIRVSLAWAENADISIF